ncbi:DUF2169 family type VI secretion system accessory protein [Consotaella aegiceratis]|uniref:DUF2169 family type VI secretion system accessory protein n=1 Tax=Consotaella aegiceratis TaxID=3097961 RepID=UPI002F40B7B6
MLQLENLTPHAAASTLLLDSDGVEHWVTVVKATYEIAEDGGIAVADAQEDVVRVPKYVGEPWASSLVRDVELVRIHPGTDIVVNGTVHAPGGRPVHSVVASASVGEYRAEIVAVGARRWERRRGALVATEPVAFATMPVIWEGAFGGRSKKGVVAQNPIGRGFAGSEDEAVDTALPTIERPDARIVAWDDRPLPAGLGAIPVGWEPRLGLAGTYDAKWRAERAPLPAADEDDRVYRTTPLGLWTERRLGGGQTLRLVNFTPSGSLAVKIPRLPLMLRTTFVTTSFDHGAVLDRVIVEPDAGRLLTVWRSTLRVGPQFQHLTRTTVMLKPRRRLRPAGA